MALRIDNSIAVPAVGETGPRSALAEPCVLDGGALLLETPDLEHRLPSLQHNRSSAERSRVLRHLFGSQEAGWAFHLDAYDETRFRQVLTALGFAVEGVKHTQCHGLANVWVLARKRPMDRRQQMAAAGSLLDEAMVDGSAIERRLRGIWQEQLEGVFQPSMSCARL